jgi:hypothetical protein
MFQQISADTKYLHIYYWPQAPRFDLPRVQYTAREVRGEVLFSAFAEKRSVAASAVFASRIKWHLDRCGILPRDLVWQADNGGNFKVDFPKALGDSQHVRIPPPTPTRAESKPCIGWRKMRSSMWKRFPVGANSSPRSTPTGFSTILCGPTRTKEIRLPGKSSWGSLLARHSNSACYRQSSWIIATKLMGDTLCLGFADFGGTLSLFPLTFDRKSCRRLLLSLCLLIQCHRKVGMPGLCKTKMSVQR